MALPSQFECVTAVCKANVYFDGKVVSHAILFADGSRKTLGLIFPGEYNFGTAAPERMGVTSGSCRVKLAGASEWRSYAVGDSFDVPGNSAFDIAVEDGIMQYICSYLS